MAKIETIKNNSSDDQLSFVYPLSEKITIDKNSLHIQLSKFKEAILDSFSVDSIVGLSITLSAVWLPFFTSDFKTIFSFNALTVQGFYLCFSFVVTIYFLFKFIFKPFYFNIISSSKEVDSNPEKMAKIILDKCSKK